MTPPVVVACGIPDVLVPLPVDPPPNEFKPGSPVPAAPLPPGLPAPGPPPPPAPAGRPPPTAPAGAPPPTAALPKPAAPTPPPSIPPRLPSASAGSNDIIDTSSAKTRLFELPRLFELLRNMDANPYLSARGAQGCYVGSSDET